jgi:alpha-amylase
MFADLDMGRDDVRAEVGAWGDWVVRALGIDGFRLDAVRHIRFPFFVDWLDRVRANAGGRELFAVGEYFSGNVSTLRWFIEQTGRRMSLFDFPLHFNMRDVARGEGALDMRRVFDGTLVAQDPTLAVTFVDNHDTWQENRRDEATAGWFLPHAYPTAGRWIPLRLLPRLLRRGRTDFASPVAGSAATGPAGPRLRAADRLLR